MSYGAPAMNEHGDSPTAGHEVQPSESPVSVDSELTAPAVIESALEPAAALSLGESRPGGSELGEAPAGSAEEAPGQSSRGGAPWLGGSLPPVHERPSFIFLGLVSAISLLADIATKAWAEVELNRRGFEPLPIWGDSLSITLAYNRGGAWGLMHNVGDMLRKPFFLGVSAVAIFFIVSLYGRLRKSQRALTWGLPLVLGGALGNLNDRITRSQVIDFIDYRADWVMDLNSYIQRYVPNWTITDHWPTFNVADIAISVGVGLMAIDMLQHNKAHSAPSLPPSTPENAGSAA